MQLGELAGAGETAAVQHSRDGGLLLLSAAALVSVLSLAFFVYAVAVGVVCRRRCRGS
jgi:hypothetical protein